MRFGLAFYGMKYIILTLLMLPCLAKAEVDLIGDENVCGDFGHQMQIKMGASLTCMPGSGPVYWLSHVPAAVKGPQKIVVVLGQKDLYEKTIDGSYKQLAQAILKQTPDCEWVGPSQDQSNVVLKNNLSNFYSQLGKAIAPCKLLDLGTSKAKRKK